MEETEKPTIKPASAPAEPDVRPATPGEHRVIPSEESTGFPQTSRERRNLLQGRLIIGVSCLTLAGVAALWSVQLDAGMFDQGDALLSSAFKIFAIVSGLAGLFFVLGARLASRIYVLVGLGAPIKGETSGLTGLLGLTGLYHVAFGWFLSVILMERLSEDALVPVASWLFFVYGVFPLILCAFCARAKKWALWASFAVFGIQWLVLTAYAIPVLQAVQERDASGRTVDFETLIFTLILDGRIFYWILTGAVALFAFKALSVSRRVEGTLGQERHPGKRLGADR